MTDIEKRQRFVSRFTALSVSGQVIFLFRLGRYFTLAGRDTYDLQGGVEDPVRLRAVNEAMHRLLDQLACLSLSPLDDHRYPDDVFANIMVDQLQMMDLDPSRVLRFFDNLPSGDREPGLK